MSSGKEIGERREDKESTEREVERKYCRAWISCGILKCQTGAELAIIVCPIPFPLGYSYALIKVAWGQFDFFFGFFFQ